MCYIFEKHGVQGYQIWHSLLSNVEYLNTQILKYSAKLQFSGTTSWYFDQKVDKTINNWLKYQQLIKISNLTKISSAIS